MTNGFKCILVPVDFSDHSDVAASYAAWFAKQTQGDVHMVHVIANPADELYAPAEAPYWMMVEHAEAKAREMMEANASRCMPPGCSWQTHVAVGDPYEHIMKAARTLHADLIVMSTRGRTGIAHLVMGSVAEKVVRHSACPVLIVPRAVEAS